MKSYLALAALSILLIPNFAHSADPGVKTCVCRKAKNSRFLELRTSFENGDEKIKQIQSFTIGSASANEAQCLAAVKTAPECGGKVADPAPQGTSVKLTGKMITPAMTAVGLKAGDIVKSIDHQPVANEKDLGKIGLAAKTGTRVDATVLRGDSTLDLWYEFPKSEPAE